MLTEIREHWVIELQNYDFKVKYKLSLKNEITDFLSWYFIKEEVNQVKTVLAYIGMILYSKREI